MDYKEILDRAKKLFFTEEVAEQKFLDAKLVDGTIVRTEADAFKAGDKLSVLTESGEVVKAPEGMHELEDGTILVVDAEGILTEVRTPEVKMESEEAAPAEEKMAEVAPEAAGLEERIAKLEEVMAMLIEGLEMKKEEMEAVKAENVSLKSDKAELEFKNEELSKVPATTPVKTNKFEKVFVEQNSKNTKQNVELLNKVASLRNK